MEGPQSSVYDDYVESSSDFDDMNDEDKEAVLKVRNMSDEQYMEYLKAKSEARAEELRREVEEEVRKIEEGSAERMRLENLARLQFQKREATRARAMKKYYDSHLSEESNFRADVERYSSLYVFSFADANIQSRKYRDFIESLSDDNLSKVYFGFNKSLAKTVGLKENQELRPGLHKVGIVLDVDDVGVLLTDHKTETEVISKFQEYSEFDFVKPGDSPKTTLVLEKKEVLQLPIRKSATKLFPILQKLGMPIKLSGRVIRLTDTFVVCEEGVPVTENASQILKHLSRKMFRRFVAPLCRWSAETGKTDYY